MRKSILLITIGAAVLAGCSKKTAPSSLPPAPVEGIMPQSYSGGDATSDAARQAALVAAAGTDRVFFEFDSSMLYDTSRATLERQAQWLIRNPGYQFTVEGHTDERGTREYNLALGERRANAAKNYLAARDVPTERLRVISYGKERLDDINSTDAAHARNRRAVSIVITTLD